MARALLIVNPLAARTNTRVLEQLIRTLAQAGWQADLEPTGGPGDARELARQGLAAGVDAVAVFGGDGTTMQAAAAMVGSEVPLALIPGGAGNLLAGNLRIPRDPVQAARLLIRGLRRRIDLGRVELTGGEIHYFGVACGAGVDAWVMGETAAGNKRRWGIGAYFATLFRVLPRLRSTECTITVDGRPLDARAILILILNCGEIIPPYLRIRPEINPTDGALNLLAVAADSPLQGLHRVYQVLRQSYRREIRESPFIRYARGSRFTIRTAEPLPVQFDGDPCGQTPFTAEVVPGALTVLID